MCVSECRLHVCIWSEELLIRASGDTGDILSKLWILTGTDKTAATWSRQTGRVTTDRATGTGQTLRRQGPGVGQLSQGLLPLRWYTPMTTIEKPDSVSDGDLADHSPRHFHDPHRLCQSSCSSHTLSQQGDSAPIRCFKGVNKWRVFYCVHQTIIAEHWLHYLFGFKNEHICIGGSSGPWIWWIHF